MTISKAMRNLSRTLVGLAVSALATFAVPAAAAEFNANVGVATQQAVIQNQGVAWGNAGSESKGNAIAAAQVAGVGTSSQWANTNTLGSSTLGAKPDNIGVTVFSGSTESAVTNAGGTITGNVQIMDGASIANGAAALGTTVGHAKVDGNFEVKQYGSSHYDATQVTYKTY